MATFSTPIAALTLSLSGILDTEGRISTGVDNSTDEYQRIHWYAQIQASAAPTAGTLYEVYGFRADGHATPYTTDGETLTDGALSLTPENAQLIGTIVVTATAEGLFYGEGVWADPGPGTWAIGIMNETGQSLGGIEANHFVHWRGEKA